MEPEPALAGLLGIAGAVAVWAIGELAEVNVLRYTAAVAMIPSLTLLCFGRRALRVLWFPHAYLFFMIPLGEGLIPWLMQGTADATIAALRLSGIPVLREGLHFSLPTGRWSVVEACSGLRYLVAALVLSALFAHLNYRRLWKGIAFVAAALILAIVANWARAYIIVMVGHLSNMRYGIGADHVVYGWAFFGLVMGVIFWMGMRFSDAQPTESGECVSSAESIVLAPAPGVRQGTTTGRAAYAGLGAAVLLGVAGFVGVDFVRDVTPRADAAAELLRQLRPAAQRSIDPQPVYEGASAVIQGDLDLPAGQGATQFYIAYFARQHDTGELIRYGNQVLALNDRRWATMVTHEVRLDDGLVVQERRIRGEGGERLVWSWFTVAGRSSAGERTAKLNTLRGMLEGRGDHSTVSVLMAPITAEGREAAAARLRARAPEVDAAVRALTSGASKG